MAPSFASSRWKSRVADVALKMHTAQAARPAATPTSLPPVVGANPAAAIEAKALKTYEDAFKFLHRDTP